MHNPVSAIRYRHCASPLGNLLLATHEHHLIGVWFEDQRHFPHRHESWCETAEDPTLNAAATQLDEWFSGCRQAFDLPLAPTGTPFQRRVWQAIAQIPFGHQLSYGALALALRLPQAGRAVGATSGRNPWSIVVPCHRLVGARGQLTGYAGGLSRKAALLTFEQANAPFHGKLDQVSRPR